MHTYVFLLGIAFPSGTFFNVGENSILTETLMDFVLTPGIKLRVLTNLCHIDSYFYTIEPWIFYRVLT